MKLKLANLDRYIFGALVHAGVDEELPRRHRHTDYGRSLVRVRASHKQSSRKQERLGKSHILTGETQPRPHSLPPHHRAPAAAACACPSALDCAAVGEPSVHAYATSIVMEFPKAR